MRIPVLVVAAVSALLLAPQNPVVRPDVLERARALAEPGEPHRMLARLAGSWDIVVRATLPGGEERTERGSVVGRVILGGRYVVLNYKLVLRGNAIEGVQILGFDNLHREYTSSWRDDHSTWSVECRGRAESGVPERIQMRGVLSDARDPTGRPFRLALTLPPASGDKVAASLHDTMDGVEFLLQTQEWTRRQ